MRLLVARSVTDNSDTHKQGLKNVLQLHWKLSVLCMEMMREV